MEGLLDMVAKALDWLFYGLVSPVFNFLVQGLEFLLLRPLNMLHVPPVAQVALIALLTAALSFFIRKKVKVDEHNRVFKDRFIAKREQQQNIKLLSDWKSRDALYRTTDQDMDEDFNSHLAQRYSQFVMTYLLPILLVLAWLNTVFSKEALTALLGSPYLVDLPGNTTGVEGLSVTFIFLLSYLVGLVIGFQVKKLRIEKQAMEIQ